MADALMGDGTTTSVQSKRDAQDNWLLRVFLSEVETQCRFALIARLDIEEALKQMHSGEPALSSDPLRIFYSVQAFLSACANAAKLLWPKPSASRYETKEQVRSRVERGKRLRQLLVIAEDETALAVLNDKRLRNYFEHFDERLDAWAETSPHHMLITRCSGAPGSFMIAGLGPGDTMGYFDYTTSEVTFQDVVISLPQMCAAIDDLHERVVRAERAGVSSQPKLTQG